MCRKSRRTRAGVSLSGGVGLSQGRRRSAASVQRRARRCGRARGWVGGRRPKLTVDQAVLAQRLYDEREKTVQQMPDMFGVPRSTVYGHLDKAKTVPRQPKKTVITKP